MTIHIHDDSAGLAAGIATRLAERLGAIQGEGRTPRVGLTGGSIAIAAYEAIAPGGVDWTDVEFWWGDERYVPVGHADRNDQQARDAFLARLGVPEHNIHAYVGHDCGLSAADAADQYAPTLPVDGFDVLLLGVGPDAHIASLFPGFPQLTETTRPVVEVFDSPKPPAVRLTLTYPVLNTARAVWFIVAGEDKAGAVAHGLADEGSVEEAPVRGVRGIEETLWLLDVAAASHLPR